MRLLRLRKIVLVSYSFLLSCFSVKFGFAPWMVAGRQLRKSDTALGQGSMVTEYVDRSGLECRDFPSGTLSFCFQWHTYLRICGSEVHVSGVVSLDIGEQFLSVIDLDGTKQPHCNSVRSDCYDKQPTSKLSVSMGNPPSSPFRPPSPPPPPVFWRGNAPATSTGTIES